MADEPEKIRIEEINGDQFVELVDHDLPAGRRYEIAGFESGVENEIAEDGINNPGASQIVYPVMVTKYLPMSLKGRFTDAFFFDGHARDMRNKLTLLAQRCNPLKIIWGLDERQGVFKQARFGEESQNDIAYELTFLIAVPPTGNYSALSQPQQTQDVLDIATQLAQIAAVAQAGMDAIAITAQVQSILSERFTAITGAIELMQVSATVFASTPLTSAQSVISAAKQVVSSVHSAQNAVTDLKKELDDLKSVDAVDIATADNQVQFYLWQLATQTQLLEVEDDLRTMRQIVTQAVKKSTELYKVQPGDTLELIALQQLGSKARALDLGITQSDLVPGNFVRIPEKTR